MRTTTAGCIHTLQRPRVETSRSPKPFLLPQKCTSSFRRFCIETAVQAPWSTLLLAVQKLYCMIHIALAEGTPVFRNETHTRKTQMQPPRLAR